MADFFALLAVAISVIAVELLWSRSLHNRTRPRRNQRLAPEDDGQRDFTEQQDDG